MKFSLHEVELPGRLLPAVPMTDEEIGRFCSANEIVDLERSADGWLDLRPIGGALTGSFTADINCQLANWNRDEEKGVVLAHAGFTLPDGSLLCPAGAWIERAAWDAMDHTDGFLFAVGAPYFLIEVVSWSRSAEMLQAKMALWLANGVQLAWLIDPDAKLVTIYRPGREDEVVERASSVEGEGRVAGFVLELGEGLGVINRCNGVHSERCADRK